MKKFLCALLLMLCNTFFPPLRAEARVVLVLSGGGTRGLAHVGVIEVLEEHGIPLAGIVGTSIGSLIGALHASGYDAAELREVVAQMDLPSLLSENAAPMYTFSGDDRKSKMSTISGLTYKKSGKRGGPLGMLTGDKLFQYYNQLMHHVDITDFDDLPIPFAAVATSIMDGEKVVLRSGSLPSAMRASMSIPGLFEPWEIDGRLLVDGGLVSNLPVNTAKDLFPNIPIVAVDVSDYPSSGRTISSFIDVLDQSMTITMRKTTVEEALKADILLAPKVQDFPFLDNTDAYKVIERGREAALASIEKIAALSAGAAVPAAPRPNRSSASVVGDVLVRGLPDSVCIQLRKQFLRWVGKPFDPEAVENAVQRLMSTPDIATVDYKLRRMDGGMSMVVLDIRREPELEFGISGYATNLHPYRWLYLKGTARGLLSEQDSMRGVLRLGEQWGIDLSYLTAPEPLNSWEFNLSAQNWEMTSSSGRRNWERYALGGQYIFQMGRMRMGLGAAYEHVEHGGDVDSVGPTFFAAYDTLDASSDPTQGQVWRLNAWWPNADEILYRLSFFKPIQVGKMWRTYLRFGYAEGNTDEAPHSAYLGAAEELYSVARSPVEAERMVWANIAFRSILKRAVWGIVAAEVFGGYGYAMDKNYDKVAAPWEVGLALTIPNSLIDIKVAAMYGSEKFTLGFFLGAPIWDHYPLP